ncbi:MAG TPA: hypothetical protein VHG32_25135 [Thermoanaerobaculia bacterium]|jgi:hypothetical protein|nr:hypothetical protein [Thermoanaerobaculia bacterium]
MSNRHRSERLIITLPPDVLDRLRTRGARSDKTHHGPYNYTNQLTRTLNLYESVVLRSDPRETRGLPETHYDLILDLLLEPHRLEMFHIHRLGEYLLELPDFSQRARRLGLEPAALAATVNGFTYAEKLHLVDSARIRHAPPPPKTGAR